MKNGFGALFVFAISSLLFAVAPVEAQTVSPAASSACVVYSSDQYPTAQGNFLKLPQGYQRPAAYQPQVAAPAPVLKAPQYIAAGSPPPAAAATPITAASASSATIIVQSSRPQVYSASTPAPSQITTSSTPAPVTTSQTVTPTNYDDLPRYSYDPNTDPAKPPYKTPIAHDLPAGGAAIPMGTLPHSFELGLKVSDYDNQEDTDKGGAAIGLSIGATTVSKSGWFFSGDLHADYGLFKDSSGGVLFDGRILAGHDFLFEDWTNGNYDLSPFAGIGYRYLYNDAEDFAYIPVGVTQNFRVDRESRMSVATELDLPLGSADFGLRASTMYQWSTWSIGPFLEYWELSSGSSDDTIEVGFQARYGF